MEEVHSGFTYILGSPGTRTLRERLFAGLNQLQHTMRKAPVGVSANQVSTEERWAVENAWTVVVIATPAFCRSRRGRELMRIRDDVRRRVVTIWKKRPGPGVAYPWSSNAHFDLPRQTEMRSVDALIKQVSDTIKYLEGTYGTNGIRGPVGRPGLFAMLSYRREEADLALARQVRDQLALEKINWWGYSDGPRKQVDCHEEIEGRIWDARVVIILLSHAWLESEECRRESRLAAELQTRRVWLLCDDSSPPEDADPAQCFDFRPGHRKKTLQRLSRIVFPSRR